MRVDGLRTVGRRGKASQKDGRIFVDRMTDVFIEINSIHTKNRSRTNLPMWFGPKVYA